MGVMPWRPIGRSGGRVAYAFAVALTALAFVLIASRPAAQEQPPLTGAARQAEAAAEVVATPRVGVDPRTLLPADFTLITGVPVGSAIGPDGIVRAIHVGGGCSTPWGDDNTRWDYRVSCSSHDLGYDLLRYAAAIGQPLGVDLRARLDDRLATDMHAHCAPADGLSAAACHVVAGLYGIGLVVNSWHQRWGPPAAEPVAALALCFLLMALLLTRLVGLVGPRGVLLMLFGLIAATESGLPALLAMPWLAPYLSVAVALVTAAVCTARPQPGGVHLPEGVMCHAGASGQPGRVTGRLQVGRPRAGRVFAAADARSSR